MKMLVNIPLVCAGANKLEREFVVGDLGIIYLLLKVYRSLFNNYSSRT